MKSDAIETIKSAVDLVEVVREVVALKRVGQNYVGLCPFHSEKTPSFSVSATKGLFYCYGCHAGGDVFKFVQKYYNWDFTQALEELARKAGVTIEKIKADPLWDEGLQILESVAELFENQLKKSEASDHRAYLKSRRIPESLVEDFRLGAHTGHPTEIVQFLKSKGFSRDLAAQLGLVGKLLSGDWTDRFRGRLMFPIIDEKGRVRGFGGRTLGQEQPKYINSPKSSLFDKSRLFYGIHLAASSIAKKGYAVLVEGYLDVMALHEFGVSNALGSMGTALTHEQIRLLKRMSSRVISLYDADRAGLSATEKNIGNFLREGIESKVVMMPSGKDPDAFLHQADRSPEDLRHELKGAFEKSELALDYLVKNSVLKEETPMARAKKFRELTRLLDEVPDEIERTLLKKDLAKRFDLSEGLLLKNEGPSSPPAPSVARGKPAQKAAKEEVIERREREILKFLIQYGEKGQFGLTDVIPYLSSASRWSKTLRHLADLSYASAQLARLDWIPQEESEDIDEQVRRMAHEWVLQDCPDLKADQAEKMWQDLIVGLKKGYYQSYSRRLQDQIAEAEKGSNFEHLKKLLAEKQDLVKVMRSFESKGIEL